jgi:hypothetical protein
VSDQPKVSPDERVANIERDLELGINPAVGAAPFTGARIQAPYAIAENWFAMTVFPGGGHTGPRNSARARGRSWNESCVSGWSVITMPR